MLSKHRYDDYTTDLAAKLIVSIVTPVLNGMPYLVDCLESVLRQDYPDVEQVIMDGGSTDGTLEKLADYQARYPEKIHYVSEPGLSIADAWTKGISLSRGDVLGWLGADDVLRPGAVRQAADFLEAAPDRYFVFGNCDFIDASGTVIGTSHATDFNLREIIREKNVIPCTSAFFRREVFEKVGPFEETIGSDRDYWIRVARQYTIHRIDAVLSGFRMHAGSNTTGASRQARLRHLRADHLTTRKYGGGFCAPYNRRYYTALIQEYLRPVLGFSYPWLRAVVKLFKRK